jgi:hypothetical protein
LLAIIWHLPDFTDDFVDRMIAAILGHIDMYQRAMKKKYVSMGNEERN